jgi:hypothetical protein
LKKKKKNRKKKKKKKRKKTKKRKKKRRKKKKTKKRKKKMMTIQFEPRSKHTSVLFYCICPTNAQCALTISVFQSTPTGFDVYTSSSGSFLLCTLMLQN